MAEYEMLAERIISGKGVLKVPDIDESYRVLLMLVNVIREPKNLYQSFEWNPPKGMYARMTFRRDKYVLFDDKVEYDGQAFQQVLDTSGQTLIAVKCAYEGILQSFVNLVNGLAGTPGGIGIFVTGVTDLIKDYENLDLSWDEVLFQCYSSTALQVRFMGLKYDTCDPLKDKKRRPPPPPPPLPKVPPDTPIGSISEPYDPETDDDNNTEPFPGDESDDTPVPPTEECVAYTVLFTVTDTAFETPQSGDVPIWGELADWRVTYSVDQFTPPGNPFSDTVQLQLLCRGLNALGNPCGELEWMRIYGQVGANTLSNVIITLA